MAEQVWSGSEWVDAPPVVAVGTVAASGKVWDGGFWVDPKSPSAERIRKDLAAGRLPAAPRPSVAVAAADPIARRLTGVIFGLIAVLCAVAAISMQPVFGRDAGGLAMLAALAVAFGFGVAALVKSS